MKNYALGFLFDELAYCPRSVPRVVLLRKNRPLTQADKYNGVGGLIESGETAMGAMCREFKEETGLTVASWKYVTTFSDDATFRVYVFSAIGDVDAVRSLTDEIVSVFLASRIPVNSMSNLEWLIPLCMARERDQWHPDCQPRIELNND